MQRFVCRCHIATLSGTRAELIFGRALRHRVHRADQFISARSLFVEQGSRSRRIEGEGFEEAILVIREVIFRLRQVTADKLAEQIAATYIGKQAEIAGRDLGAESSKMLQQVATDITDEYNKELNPLPTQLLYDAITDHGRNDVVVKDAVVHALKNVTVASIGAQNAER